MTTHYQVLGVDRDASSVDIASAFRDRLARLKADPDTAPEAIAAVRDAYQTLANPASRDAYDETLVPARPVRAARAPVDAAQDEDAPPFWQTPRGIAAISVAVAVVAVWGWKRNHKPKPPEVHVVSTVTLESPSPATAAPGKPDEVRAPAAAPDAAASAPSPPLSAQELFANASPSVVRVIATDARGQQVAQGSGVVVGAGRVITNCHVTKAGSSVVVKAGSDARPATVAVADEELDLCALDVSRLDAPAAGVGSVASLRTGQRVYAIGAPMGLELTLSEGIVSGLRDVGNGTVIQTTAAVSPGSSGGGLFSADGQLVGIVTFPHRYGQDLNVALPADWIADMRARASSSAPSGSTRVAAPAEPTTAEMVVGSWHCFGSLSGRNGDYTYGDGMLRIVSADGRNLSIPYRVVGRTVQYAIQGQAFALEIESISERKMVQVLGAGERLACDRN